MNLENRVNLPICSMSMINLNGRLRVHVIGHAGDVDTLYNIVGSVLIDLHHPWFHWKVKDF